MTCADAAWAPITRTPAVASARSKANRRTPLCVPLIYPPPLQRTADCRRHAVLVRSDADGPPVRASRAQLAEPPGDTSPLVCHAIFRPSLPFLHPSERVIRPSPATGDAGAPPLSPDAPRPPVSRGPRLL